MERGKRTFSAMCHGFNTNGFDNRANRHTDGHDLQRSLDTNVRMLVWCKGAVVSSCQAIVEEHKKTQYAEDNPNTARMASSRGADRRITGKKM